jgi:hypothetical protein
MWINKLSENAIYLLTKKYKKINILSAYEIISYDEFDKDEPYSKLYTLYVLLKFNDKHFIDHWQYTENTKKNNKENNYYITNKLNFYTVRKFGNKKIIDYLYNLITNEF